MPLFAFTLTFFLSAAIALFIPFGNDTAAHLHLVDLLRSTKSLSPYDPWWYFGKVEFVGYSLAYYPLAALSNVYIPPIIALSATAGLVVWFMARSFDATSAPVSGSAMTRIFGFAVVCSLNLAGLMLTGAYPFLSSLPFFVLASLLVVREENSLRYSLLVVIGSLFSVIGTLWIATLALTVGVTKFTNKTKNAWQCGVYTLSRLVPIVVVAVGEVISTRNLFPKGSYPFYLSDLLELSLFLSLVVAFAWWSRRPSLAFAAVIYLVGAVANFVFVRSSLGGNIARIGEFAPLITAALILKRSPSEANSVALRGATIVRRRWMSHFRFSENGKIRIVLLLSALWSTFWFGSFTIGPLTDSTAAYLERSSNWAKLASQLHREFGAQRVEYVDTALHEGAYFLPKYGIAIARGWFRQSDQPDNALFYLAQREFSRSYKSWLCHYDIASVVLPPAPYDYSSELEASLVSRGTSYLRPTATVGRFRVFEVTGCTAKTKIFIFPSTFEVVSTEIHIEGTLPIHFASQLHPASGVTIRQKEGLVYVGRTAGENLSIHF